MKRVSPCSQQGLGALVAPLPCPRLPVCPLQLRNKLPQTWWLTVIYIYCLTIRKARSPKLRCQLANSPSKFSKRGIFFASCSLWWPWEFLGLWLPHSHFCLCFHVVFSMSSFLFLIEALVFGLRASQITQDDLS